MAPKDNPLRASDVRERNEKLVLRLIREAGSRGYSQSEAVQATGLKAPSVFRIFSSLETAGFIGPLVAPSLGDSVRERKGRPRVCYAVKAGFLFTLGVEFWVDRVSVGLFDFCGDTLYSQDQQMTRGVDADAVVEIVAQAAETAMANVGVDKERVLGLGIGAPGQVNVRAREIAFYSRINGMRDYPMAARLEARLGIPVSMHNNCSVIALAEYRYRLMGKHDSVFMFLLRSGVNGAFVDGGRIYLASDGTTIETGHIAIDRNGEPCACGARGCLEAYITALDRQSWESGHWLFGELAEAMDNGTATGDDVLGQAAQYIATATRTVNRLFRPKHFLIVGASLTVAEALARLSVEYLAKAPSGFDRPLPTFEGRAYEKRLAQLGAADLVLETFFS
ncbi:MAG: ROK family protein [Spirochaetales bacterium]|nr:MAG: ROK family protein [Spirochaetales bacterium]